MTKKKVIPAAQKTQFCDNCGDEKPKKAFGWRSQTAQEKKTLGLAPTSKIRRPTCMVCEAAAEKEELGAAAADSRRTRDKRAAQKKLAFQEAKREQEEQKALSVKELARREFLQRELSRKSLLEFIKESYPKYMAGWVHVDICNRLERFLDDVVAGKNPRLMLFMPPRHGKSIIASQHFPAWGIGKYPDFEFIAASYGSGLPIKFSRYVRGLLRDPRFHQIFPDCVLDKENENVEGWGTTEGGGYIPAGVGGGITGKGANILIIDDPVKDAEEADSQIIRDSTWDWYGSTAYTRLAPQSGVLVIQTRWHDDDLSGRLITHMNDQLKELDALEREVVEKLNIQRDEEVIDDVKYAMCIADMQKDLREKRKEIDMWEIVSYPAEAEHDEYQMPEGDVVRVDAESGEPTTVVPGFDKDEARLLRHKGDALHPARYPSSRLRTIKTAIQSRHWHALFQQNPVPDEGSFFKREMLRYRKGHLDIRNFPIAIAWDLAIGKKQTNDWTVGIVGAIDYEGNIQVVDMLRGRWDAHSIARNIILTYAKYRKMTDVMCMVGIERGQLQMAIEPELNRLSKEMGIYPVYDKELKPLTDKLVRARPLQGYAEAGKVVIADPELNPWVEILVHELLRFPSGTFDDCVDAIAWLTRMVERNFSSPTRLDPEAKRRKRDGIKTVKQRLKEAMQEQLGGNDPMAA